MAEHLSASRRQMSNVLQPAPKRTQRERLVAAMIELSAQVGYQEVSVAQVSSHAGISTATFYQQFASREDCLLAAYRSAARSVFGGIPKAVGDGHWSDTARSALGDLLTALRSDPNTGRVLFIEALAAGPQVREERERVLEEFERCAEELLERMLNDGHTLDIPVAALIGAVRGIVSRHLRTYAEDDLPLLLGDMLAWMGRYAIPAGQARWSTGPHSWLPVATQDDSPARSAPPLQPARLPRGRHRLPAGVVARSQRTRIIYATAEVTMAKGYADATVTDIVAAAGIARKPFYEHFASKQHAFLEAQEHSIQNILDACAAAYVSAEDWPERVWRGLDALIGLIVGHSALSHLRLVECYSAGPAAIRRAEKITALFTIFLAEGYGYRPQARELPRLCSEAIAGAVLEFIQRDIALGDSAALPRRLPQLTYIVIAPFIGPEEAIRRVEQLSVSRSHEP